jgi:hypothetical protein
LNLYFEFNIVQLPETPGHILWSCPSAQDVWLECKGKFQKCLSGEVGFMELLEKLLQRLDVEEMQLMVTVARQIWLRRNSVIFGGDFLAPFALVRLAKEQVEAYNATEKRIGEMTPCPRQQRECRWEKPPEGTLKLNWDAAVDRINRKIGMGVVARDHEGRVIAMTCGPHLHISDPPMAEAMAAREAVQLGRFLGGRRFILEGDALEVVSALRKEEDSMGSIGQIINDMKILMNDGAQWKVQHVRREGNRAAHTLAKFGIQQMETQQWNTDFPVCMNDVIFQEQAPVVL